MMRQLIEPTEDLMDARVLREFLEMVGPEGPALLHSIVETYAVETPPLLLALGIALERGDCVAIARLAHRLKGSCLSIGASGLAARCAILEQACSTGYPPPRTSLLALEEHFSATTAALRAFVADLR
ncbi:MAG: Hpt domain-containing protein [Chloroflexi bacterium]|nr:Hpt domain-containing protein [Chloroflexota bacterium]